MESTDAFEKVRGMFAGIQDEFLRTKPMWMRLNLITNMLNQARNNGKTEKDIDWDKVNEYLTINVDEYDFNCFDRIESFKALYEATMQCHESSILNMAWQKHKCKDCDTEFHMSYKEVHFYKDKELHIPKRCKDCRDYRRQKKVLYK